MTRIALRHAARLRIRPATKPGPAISLDLVQSGAARLLDDPPIGPADGQNIFEPGDVLFSKLRPYLAKSLLVQERSQGTGEFLCIEPGAGTDPRFLLYATLSRPWLHHAGLTSFGSKMPRTSWEAMASFRLYRPALEEQRRIADFLDDRVARIDAAVRARHVQIELVESMLSTRCQEVLSRSSDAHPGRLKALLSAPPSYGVLKPEYVDDGVPIVRIVDLPVHGEVSVDSVRRITVAQSAEYARTVVRAGDVIIGVVGTIGRPAVVDAGLDGANLSRAVARLRVRKGVDPRFVRSVLRLRAFTEWTRQITQGTAQAVLNMGDLPNYPVPIPAPRETFEVSERLAGIEADCVRAVDRLERAARALLEYKQSLITAAVTGELDVATASGRSLPA